MLERIGVQVDGPGGLTVAVDHPHLHALPSPTDLDSTTTQVPQVGADGGVELVPGYIGVPTGAAAEADAAVPRGGHGYWLNGRRRLLRRLR